MKETLPKKWPILGIWYKVNYYKYATEIDLDKEEALEGQGHREKQVINIKYDPETQDPLRAWQTLFHEFYEIITMELRLESFLRKGGHDDLDRLATASAMSFREVGMM